MRKYPIPNTVLTIILTNRKKLRKMETRVQLENKYLIPMTNLLIKYVTLRSTTAQKTVDPDLLPEEIMFLAILGKNLLL